MKKLLGILLLLGVFSVYAANNNILCSIEYFYSDDGMLIGKAINGNRINYEYDLRGQLLSVKDTNGKILESYTYDKVGNILSKTVNGKTTAYTYDKANQLISSTIDGKTTNYKYDAAGRMVQAGSKTYRYKYLDKVAEVRENGKVIAEFEYTVEGQVSTATYGDKTEEFMWDGLALIQRNDISYLNEPYVTGGNPVMAGDDVLFNDMLGSTLAVNGKAVEMTSFGETGNKNAFFTGKPMIDELGYTFLFRDYNPNQGKWTTSDPLGYPDGWNNLAYCKNHPNKSFDYLGAVDVLAEYLWSACYGVASAGTLKEAFDPYAYNYAGFLHWLTGNGETVYLSWECFDRDYSKAYMMITNIYLENRSSCLAIAEDLLINASASVVTPSTINSDSFISHNIWISLYNISVFSTQSISIEVSRIDSSKCIATVTATLQCYDRADFNPGQTFMEGMLSDDSFIYLQQQGYACDFNEYSERSFTKQFEFISTMKE